MERRRPKRIAWSLLGLGAGLALVGISVSARFTDSPDMTVKRASAVTAPAPLSAPVSRPAAVPAPARSADPEPQTRPPHVVRQVEEPPVSATLSAATHGLDLIAAGAPAIPLDPREAYEVWIAGEQYVSPDAASVLASLNGAAPTRLARPASRNPFDEGNSGRVHNSLVAIESPGAPAAVRVLGSQPIVIQGASRLYPFILRDRPGGQYSSAPEVRVRPRRSGITAPPMSLAVPLYVDDDQRLMVRSLAPQKGYRLELDGPKGTPLVCVLGGRVAGGPLPQVSGAVGAVGTDFVVTAPGRYGVTGAPFLWCTLPFASPEDRKVELHLAAIP